MRRRLLTVLIVAVAIGLTASLLVYRVVAQVAGARTDQSDKIVVAAANMGMAETVTARHVKLVAWPKTGVPDGAFRKVEDVEGRVVRASVVSGEPMIEAKLAPNLAGRGGIMPMLVPDGQRGVTIKVDEATRDTGFVLPNSRVDVLVSMTRTKGSDERIAKVILQDVPVLAAGQTVEMRDNKPVTVTTVTLALSPEQTERLAVAQAEGRLTLAMRNLRDNRLVSTPGATPTALLSDGHVADSRPAAPPAASVAPTPKRAPAAASAESHHVSVIRGSQVSEKVFTRSGNQGWTEQAEAKK